MVSMAVMLKMDLVRKSYFFQFNSFHCWNQSIYLLLFFCASQQPNISLTKAMHEKFDNRKMKGIFHRVRDRLESRKGVVYSVNAVRKRFRLGDSQVMEEYRAVYGRMLRDKKREELKREEIRREINQLTEEAENVN